MKSNSVAARRGKSGRRNGLDVAARVIIAIPGGYAATAACAMLLARLWPAPRLDASLWATILSFAIYAALVVWTFAASSAWRAGLVVLAIGLAAGFGAILAPALRLA